mmetsp:Transcript_14402/g.14238  ORF Transcript_14402/g.14238 Transcript_14402/m.14238 type:complete len:96 (+) Transcript_14402:464-751(+)
MNLTFIDKKEVINKRNELIQARSYVVASWLQDQHRQKLMKHKVNIAANSNMADQSTESTDRELISDYTIATSADVRLQHQAFKSKFLFYKLSCEL